MWKTLTPDIQRNAPKQQHQTNAAFFFLIKPGKKSWTELINSNKSILYDSFMAVKKIKGLILTVCSYICYGNLYGRL